MELRVLRYFLMVAREENITRASQLLHVTQPTLSRQLMQLEDELGVQLFHRGKYSVTLTEDGMLLRRRAEELVSLSDKTVKELMHKEETVAGEVSIGCGETRSMAFISEQILGFRSEYPQVHFDIHSATADDIKERLEKGLLDIGLLAEPVDISRYEFIRMPFREQWGILTRRDSELAGLEYVTPADIAGHPLLIAKREQVRNELAAWFGDCFDKLDIAATYNLIINAATLVRSRVGIAVCFDLGTVYEDLVFVPLKPVLETGSVLVWKKNQLMPEAARRFLSVIKNTF